MSRFAVVLAAVLLPGVAAAPLPAQRAPVTLEKAGQWGCLECSSGHQFGEIAGVAVTAEGTMYVLDRDEPRIRIFEAQGRMRLGTGRRGQGPGELEAPFAIGVQADGSFRVVDIRTSRITHYGADGRVIGTHALRGAMPVAASLDPSTGALWIAGVDFRERTGIIERWDAGASAGVVVVKSTDGFPPSEGIAGTVDALAVSPRGAIAVGDGRREYRIRRWSADGRLLAPDIVRAIERTPRTAEEIAEVQERLARAGSRVRAAMEQQTGRSSSGTPTPPAVDPLRNHFGIAALQYDDAGRLWVKTARGGPSRTIFDLFDPAGRFLGEVELPAAIGMFDIAGDHLVAVVRGEDDVPQLSRWMIRER